MTAATDRDAMSKIIHDTIDKLPHAARLYPDIYSDKVADALLDAGFKGVAALQHGTRSSYENRKCRCDACKAANNARSKAVNARRREDRLASAGAGK